MKMFGQSSKVCMDIAENINGAHHIWVPGKNVSYISLNSDELIFTCNQIKYQVLGHPSARWNTEHFVNIDETAKGLATQILEQVEEYRKEGRVIIGAKEWLAEVEAFYLKEIDWRNRLWVDDIDKLEIKLWVDFLETQENPIFQDLAVFLNCFLNDDEEVKDDRNPTTFRELLPSEIDAANKLADFLANHSNELLCEGAEWITQWMTYR
jgi:hypothetical protein